MGLEFLGLEKLFFQRPDHFMLSSPHCIETKGEEREEIGKDTLFLNANVI
jgi:hypothetical protein